MKTFVVVCAVALVIYLFASAATHPKPALAAVEGACLYEVHYGDWLSTIAPRYGFKTWQDLYNQNRAVIGANANIIYPGEHLNVCHNSASVTYAPAGQALANPSTASGTGSIRQDILNVFGPVYGPGAVGVAICESSLIPTAWNPQMVYWNGQPIGHAAGVFQIVDGTWAATPYAAYSRYNTDANIKAAWWLFSVRDHYNWYAEWPDTAHCAG